MKNKDTTIELTESWSKTGSYTLRHEPSGIILANGHHEVISFDGIKWSQGVPWRIKENKAALLREYLENRF